jgi:hypothetical protein
MRIMQKTEVVEQDNKGADVADNAANQQDVGQYFWETPALKFHMFIHIIDYVLDEF